MKPSERLEQLCREVKEKNPTVEGHVIVMVVVAIYLDEQYEKEQKQCTNTPNPQKSRM